MALGTDVLTEMETETAMGTTRRTQVEAIDDLTAELRLSNQIAVLGLGAPALDDVEPTAKASEATVRRQGRLNVLRAEIRRGLGIGVDPADVFKEAGL